MKRRWMDSKHEAEDISVIEMMIIAAMLYALVVLVMCA